MMKSSGDQVGFLMFRKSGIVKAHANERKSQSLISQNGKMAQSYEYEKEDLDQYDKNEAKEFFTSKKEADQQEARINEAIKALSNTSDLFEPNDNFDEIGNI